MGKNHHGASRGGSQCSGVRLRVLLPAGLRVQHDGERRIGYALRKALIRSKQTTGFACVCACVLKAESSVTDINPESHCSQQSEPPHSHTATTPMCASIAPTSKTLMLLSSWNS